MNAFAAYGAINTKIHARKKSLLSNKEWQKTVEFKSVVQVIDFLKKRPGYKRLLNDYKIEDVHRTELEVVLDRYIVSEIENMLHYFSGSYKVFFKTFLMEYEINDLQLLLRSISRNENMQGIEHFFVHSQKYGLTIYDKLITCKNVIQFIEALKGTIYYDTLKTMAEEDIAKREFHMEMKLYILFYKQLMEVAEQLAPKDKKIAKKIIGTKIDLINIQWIYRATKYYDISPEEILIYSLPFGDKVNYQRLKILSYTKNLDEYKKLVQRYISSSLFQEESDAFLEHTIDRQLYHYIMRMNTREENISLSLAYIYTLYIEVQDLVALTEGIRYTLPQDELKKYLVHTI
ncbi:V-type ATPase subunit [Cellulosilyticum sp. I15G10I2]|uniref:V-type ATPase subunit n=1 Tax=Cellulosilyticum sp. I15G10I2 TaxID=1892843 RepID=UPI00085BE8E8|nr:V-type ATPase subunit [Cellulosilyticum sp. I15G10I2]